MSYLGRSAKLSRKTQEKVSFLATAGQTSKTGLSYVPTFVEVSVNGILLTDVTDYTATSGSSITFSVALELNDEVTVVSLKTFALADHYTKVESDAAHYTKSAADSRFEPIDSAYTKAEADANLAALVDSSPAALNTLNELAAALGDDANFSTTITNSIATKLPLAGGTLTGDVSHGDNVKAKFGTGNDLSIYHDGSHSNIEETGTGNLNIRGSNLWLTKPDGTVYFGGVNSNGESRVYFNGSQKLATTATGVDVTGTVTADVVTVTPNSSNISITAGSYDSTNNVRLNAGGTTSNYLEYRGYLGHIFDVNTTGKMRINSMGVGIGTTNPLGQLQVGGSTTVSADSKIIFGKSTATSQGYLPVIQHSSTGGVGNDLVLAATSTDGAIRMYTGASSGSGISQTGNNAERLRINKDGNVGIGNTASGFNAQADNLSVGTGSGANGITIYSGNDSSGNIFFADGTSGDDPTRGGINYNHANNSISFRVNDSPKMSIASDGKVGIGTASPAQELDISSTNPAVRLTDTTTSGLYHELVSYADNLRFAADKGNVEADTKIEFYIDNAEKMRIDSAGDITVSGGIFLGGTSDTAALSNKLDDYETGSFTASIRDAPSGGNAQSIGTQYYTKIGNQVTVWILRDNITISGLTSNNTFFITGLPFTSASNNVSVGSIWWQYINTGNTHVVAPRISLNVSYIRFDELRDNANDTGVTIGALNNNVSDIVVTITYQAA